MRLHKRGGSDQSVLFTPNASLTSNGRLSGRLVAADLQVKSIVLGNVRMLRTT